MITDLNLKIKDIGPINETSIDIGKLNVIGGLNATGKSTASKLLYCFLKGGCVNRQELAYSWIDHEILRLLITNEEFRPDKLNISSSKSILEFYYDLKKEVYDSKENSFSNKSIIARMEKIDKQLETIEKNDNKLYESILKKLLDSEFNSQNLSGFTELKGCFEGKSFDYKVKISEFYSFSGFFLLNDIFYIDSLSLLDNSDFNRKEHISEMASNLWFDEDESIEFLDDEINDKIIKVEKKIKKLIKGKFESKKDRLSFVTEEGYETSIGDTSSGIKQIGIIQILLATRKLKENSFLIIDEPEVNLHPEWQIKFAEILSILARDLNIYVYINTHSPMFIEAMSIYSEYYGLLDETYFYLTERSDNGFYFKKIAHNNMGAVYGNLARPYDELDKIKVKLSHEK